jgi:hypothetical protein
MSELVWTTERPTVPGWYWGRHAHILDLVMVWVGQDAIDSDLFKPGTEWAGPIPEPRPTPAEGPGQGAAESA